MSHGEKHHDYHLIDPSPWPLIASFSAMTMFVGLAIFMDSAPGTGGFHAGIGLCALGTLGVLAMMYIWWRDVIKEGRVDNDHTPVVRKGLRLGMALFIVSEVMFFFAFFWSYFKAWLSPTLRYDGDTPLNSEQVAQGVWPPAGIETLDAWDLPFINTLILLLSGTTVTWAHYAVLNGMRCEAIKALSITVALGVIFSLLQALEYSHALFGLSDGVYAANFYMATGFHGAHVLIGTIFLAICLVRIKRNHMMPPEGHLGFEFAAWYWHFVDVVWLFLFMFVYVLGGN